VFDGFADERLDLGPVVLRVRRSPTTGPAVVLLHGHPRTAATWHAVARLLHQAGYTVVCPDLRGYGRSSKPDTTDDHAPYSKRAMAADVPERAILADPDAWYGGTPEHMGAAAFAEYRQAIHDPETVRAMLEDYRAGLGLDRAHDEADRAAGRRVACPTLVLWSRHDDLEHLYGDPLRIWADWAEDLRGGHSIESGHHMAEEAPAEVAAALLAFLGSAPDGLR